MIAERHFASSSSLATSDVASENQRSPRFGARGVTRRISFEDEQDTTSDRDKIADLRDPDAVLNLSDDVFGTPMEEIESRRLADVPGTSKMRKVATQTSSKSRSKRKAKASPPAGYDGSQFRSSATIAALIEDEIDTIESTRLRSKNLSGPMSHTIKLCVQKVKMALADLATRSELVGDASYMHLRETELTRQAKELKNENSRLKEQLDTLNREFRQFRQDVHDGKIGGAPKKTKDMATSPHGLPIFAASVPAGSRPTNAVYDRQDEGSGYAQALRERELPPVPGGILRRRRGSDRETSLVDRRRPHRLAQLEREGELSDLPTASDTEWSVAAPRRRRRKKRATGIGGPGNNTPRAPSSEMRRQPTRGNSARVEQRPPRIRPPRSAAVAIRIPGGRLTYADVMKKARREVNLDNLEMGDTRM